VLSLVVFLLAEEGGTIQPLNAISSPIVGLVVGAILCLVVLLVVNSVRDDLRIYNWFHRVPRQQRRYSLPVVASIAFTL